MKAFPHLKKIVIILVAVLLLAVTGFLAFYESKPYLEISVVNDEWYYGQSGDDQRYRGWEVDGVTHLYLPYFFSASKMIYAGEGIDENDGSIPITYDEPVRLRLLNKDGSVYENDICIHKGSPVYTININLDGDYEAAAINKEDYIGGSVRVTDPDGREEPVPGDVLIKGRGNSTWFADKQPYVLYFDNKIAMAGLDASKKFVLLANYYDGTKFLNNMMFDLNREAGMYYSVASSFADVYINGNYRGLYTVCEPVDNNVGKLGQKLQKANRSVGPLDMVSDESAGIRAYSSLSDPDDISGVYLIEKTISEYRKEDEPGFRFGSYDFAMKYPNNLTVGEAKFVKDRFMTIDDLIRKKDPAVFKYIDIDSFATRYILEEFAFDSDAMMTSWYFYYRSGDPLLYAGPGWDYDGAFGETNNEFREYTRSIFEIGDIWQSDEMLEWDRLLFEMPEYRSYLIKKYEQIRPRLVALYTDGVDGYADLVHDSVDMDMIRWCESEFFSESGHYKQYDSTVKYLKFYMYQRIRMMDEKIFGEERPLKEPSNSADEHVLTFKTDDEVIKTIKVQDGALIRSDMIPGYDKEKFLYWRYSHNLEEINSWLPVYEDTEFVLEPADDDSEDDDDVEIFAGE